MWANNPQTLTPTDPNQRATTVKDPDITEISVACWKNSENKLKTIKIIPEAKTVTPIPLTRTVMSTTTTITETVTAERKPKTVYPPCETCGKTNHSTEKCCFGANAANRPPPRHRRPERQNQVPVRANQSDSNEAPQATAQKLNYQCHVFTPELRVTDRRQLTQNFHQFQRLSGSNPRRPMYLISIKLSLMKLINIPTCTNLNREVM